MITNHGKRFVLITRELLSCISSTSVPGPAKHICGKLR
jgi:hypothetical protein